MSLSTNCNYIRLPVVNPLFPRGLWKHLNASTFWSIKKIRNPKLYLLIWSMYNKLGTNWCGHQYFGYNHSFRRDTWPCHGDPFTEDLGVDNDEHSELPDPPPRPRQPFNQQGIWGNPNHHNQHYVCNDDPFAKVKFSISSFNGSYNVVAYLDWEMTIEQ
jgi:hypothetical protein